MDSKIAYILKGFPRLSETFISNEILLLEKLGTPLTLFSVKHPAEEFKHESISAIRSELEYLPSVTSLSNTGLFEWLWRNFPIFWPSHKHLCRRRPFRYIATLSRSLWMSLRYRENFYSRPRKVFIKEFIQAGYIACRILESGRFQHCHAHFCHGATTIALFVSWLTGLSFSFTAHAKDIYQKNQNPGDLLDRKIKASSFITTCTGANEIYLNWYGRQKKIHKIYHGVDIAFFKPAQRPYSRSRATILAVGRLVEKKGFDYLLRACSILRRKGFNFNCRIIGERGEQYPILLEQIKGLGLEDFVNLEGPKTHQHLLTAYQQSSMFVLPCRLVEDGDRDGIPNVLVEAMACGLPVISTEVSGIPELIESGKNGLLVKPDDSESLSIAMERLLTSSMLATRLSSHARRTVCERFDSAKTIRQLQILFASAIEAKTNTKGCDQGAVRVRP